MIPACRPVSPIIADHPGGVASQEPPGLHALFFGAASLRPATTRAVQRMTGGVAHRPNLLGTMTMMRLAVTHTPEPSSRSAPMLIACAA